MFKKEDAKSYFVTKQTSGSSYKTYVFECSGCGADMNIQLGGFKKHTGKCRKCCQKKRPYEFMLNELVRAVRKKKHIEINITYEEFMELISNPECHYCTKPLHYNPHTRSNSGDHVSRAYQLDRKNNTKGYIKDNLVPCCWDCNRIKSDIYTYEEFMIISEALKKVYKLRTGTA